MFSLSESRILFRLRSWILFLFFFFFFNDVVWEYRLFNGIWVRYESLCKTFIVLFVRFHKNMSVIHWIYYIMRFLFLPWCVIVKLNFFSKKKKNNSWMKLCTTFYWVFCRWLIQMDDCNCIVSFYPINFLAPSHRCGTHYYFFF